VIPNLTVKSKTNHKRLPIERVSPISTTPVNIRLPVATPSNVKIQAAEKIFLESSSAHNSLCPTNFLQVPRTTNKVLTERMNPLQNFSQTIDSIENCGRYSTGGSNKNSYARKEYITEEGSQCSKSSFGQDLPHNDYHKQERGKYTYQMLPAGKRKPTFGKDNTHPPLSPVRRISMKSIKYAASVSNENTRTPKSNYSHNFKSGLSKNNSVKGDLTPGENRNHTRRS
jgi:hypothetical protein